MPARSTPGDRSLLLLAPQVVLGAALRVFPDERLPRAAQVIVLLHVLTAIASAAAFAAWAALHVRGRVLRPPVEERGGLPARQAVRLALALVALGAWLSGAAAAWGGEGTLSGDLHALFGMGVALPLAAHLLLDASGATRAAGALLLATAPLLVPGVSHAVASRLGADRRPAAVAFERRTRDPALYDNAEWCGSCHPGQLEEWSHSSHARALRVPNFRRQLAEQVRAEGRERVDSDLDDPAAGSDQCVMCHAPTTFYGKDERPALEDGEAASQGIACGFCHTLRGRGPGRMLYVSAPETVRRYLGQDAPGPLARQLGDLLIRWRPEVHRRDYHVAWLDRAASCGGCHLESFESWQRSSWAGHAGADARAEAADAVRCQDCHMARAPTGGRALEPGPLVPWGRVRAQRRHHGFAGGNVNASLAFDDATGARDDRRLRAGMVAVRIVEARREAGRVAATVALQNLRVGHLFPTGEGGDVRNEFLELQALDGAGRLLAATARPMPADRDRHEPRERPGVGVALLHADPDKGEPPAAETRVPPFEERSFHLSLPDRPEVARVRVVLRSGFDPQPIADAERAL